MGMTSGAGAVGSMMAAAHNDQDATFAGDMVMHHQQAIEMADLAPGRAHSAEVLALAARIKAAQGPEITTMNDWMKKWGMAGAGDMPGMDMSASMPGMMSKAEMKELKGLTGPDFDRRFLTMMIAHHQGALTMAQTELTKGESPVAQALAQGVVTTQTAEIATMRALLG